MSRSTLLRLLLFMTFALRALPAPAQTLIYYVDGSRPDDASDGRSWATAKKTLTAALLATDTAHQVWVKRGIYPGELIIRSKVAIYGGFAGDETALPQRNILANPSVIWGGGRMRCMSIIGHFDVQLDGLTLAEGVASGNYSEGYGGGLYIDYDPDVRLANCMIVNNSASLGGGIGWPKYDLTDSSLTLTNCIFAGNSAESGGALYATHVDVDAAHCTFMENRAHSESGGISIDNAFTSSLVNCLFSGNGPVAIHEDSIGNRAGSTLRLVHSLFHHNALGDYSFEDQPSIHGANDIAMNLPGALNNVDGDPKFVMDGAGAITGTWAAAPAVHVAANTAMLVVAGASFAPGALQGRLIYLNSQQTTPTLILDNAATTLTVSGVAAGVKTGDRWRLFDYRLAQGSAALDRGATDAGLATDLEGDPRPGADGLVDIGADEAASALTPPVDPIPPVSSVTLTTNLSTSYSLSIPYVASDNQSAISGVRLFQRRNGGAWMQYPDAQTSFAGARGAILFDSTRTGGDGHYEFYTLATDAAGNVEAPPASPDAFVNIVTAAGGGRLCVDANAPLGRMNGSDWANACPTIPLAVALAAKFGVKEIWVAEGTYAEPLTLQSNLALYGGFEGYGGAEETTLTQRNPARNATILSGARRFTPVTLNKTQNTRLDGFTITEGANRNGSGGGVICVQTLAPTLFVQCVITSNTAKVGGGVHLDTATATFTSCTLSENVAASPAYSYESSGGGLYFNSSQGALTLEGCRIMNNSALVSGGGACIKGYASVIGLKGCLVAGNTATGGGGLCFSQVYPTLSECIISGNRATDGGGVIASSNTKAVNCVFSGNQAILGGAVFGAASDSFTHCTFDGNQAASLGGALYTEEAGDTLTNCILSRNAGCAVVENLSVNHYVYTSLPTINTSLKNCLFHLNPDGDFWDQAFHGREGTRFASAAELNIAGLGCTSNKDGNPSYVMDGPGALAGAWSAVEYTTATNRTTLTDAAAALTTGALAYRLIIPDQDQCGQAAVLSNTATRVVVAGKLDGVAAGDRYRVLDVHLRDGSAALECALGGGGMPLADIEGEARPGGDSLRDIGADEAPESFVPADVTAPVTQVGALALAYKQPSASQAAEFDVPFTASDKESGLKSVTLHYRRNGGAWTPYGSPVSASPIHFIAPGTSGGVYEFYTVGVDQLNNTELPPLKPDARTVVAPAFASPVVYVNGAAGAGGDGSSWDKAVPDISTGLALAALFQAPSVWVARGTYKEMISSSVNLYGGFAGFETSPAQRDLAANLTTIDASGYNPSDSIVKLSGGRLDGFTVTGGNCFKAMTPTHRGGGVYCDRASSVIANCRITGNRALFGGGVYCAAGSQVTLDRCQIHGNEATDTGGGVAYGEAVVQLYNSVVAGNTATRGGGLGYSCVLSEYNGANALGVKIVHCTIAMNYAGSSSGNGGGVYHVQTVTTGVPKFELYNSIVAANSSYTNSYTNFVYSGGPGGLFMIRSQISNSQGALSASINGAQVATLAALNALPNCRDNVAGSNYYEAPKGFSLSSTSVWPAGGLYNPYTNLTSVYFSNPRFYADAPGSLKGYLLIVNLDADMRQFVIQDNEWGRLYIQGDVTDLIFTSKAYTILNYRLQRGSAALDAGEPIGSGTVATDLDGRARPLDIRNVGLDGPGAGYDLGAYEAHAYQCRLQVIQTTHGAVMTTPAPTSPGDYFYLLGDYGTTVTLTATPSEPKHRFVRWNGNAPVFSQNKNPLPLTLDGDLKVSATFARESGAVRIDATPNTAPWSFTDGDGATHSGVGDATVGGVPTGAVTLTWGALAKYDRPAPYSVTRTLDLDTTLTIKGIYKQQVGVVNITIWPATTRWTLTDGSGGKRSGIGSARLVNVPIGALKLAWTAPAGYLAPALNPAALTLANGQELFVGECLAPAAAATTPALRTKNEIVRYLLGITTTATGLDLTGDGKVTAADLVRSMKP